MNEEYYLLEGDDKKGPFTFDELVKMDIGIYTEIITPVSDKPQYASELPELNGILKRKVSISLPKITWLLLANAGWPLLLIISPYTC